MNKVLKIFDMDRTLINTPDFTHFINTDTSGVIDTKSYFPEQFTAVKSIFWDTLMKEVGFKKENDYAVVINTKNDSKFDGMQLADIFAKNPKAENYLELYNDTIVVKHPSGFYTDPETLGYSVNDYIYKAYESASNKMVLTGRGEKLRPDILKMFRFLKVEEPNQGLMLWPSRIVVINPTTGKKEIVPIKIKEWKAQVITQAASTGKWSEIHFYEDREDWLSYAQGVMNSTYPNIKFVPHLVTNVNDVKKI